MMCTQRARQLELRLQRVFWKASFFFVASFIRIISRGWQENCRSDVHCLCQHLYTPLEILEYLWLETSNLLRSLQTVGSQDVALYFLVAQVMPVQWTWTMKKSRALWVFLAWKGAARGNIPGKKVLLKACSKNIYGQSFLLMCYCRH